MLQFQHDQREQQGCEATANPPRGGAGAGVHSDTSRISAPKALISSISWGGAAMTMSNGETATGWPDSMAAPWYQPSNRYQAPDREAYQPIGTCHHGRASTTPPRWPGRPPG